MKKVLILFITMFIFIIPVQAKEFPNLYSKNIYLYNLDTNEVLYEKNANEKTLIASLTKVMTSIVAIENIDNIDEKVILTKDIFDYLSYDLSLAGFKVNEEVTYRDLLYGSLLPSGADATHSLAVFISGSEEKYIELMNQKVKDLGLKNTHFSNTIGIEDDNNTHFSTVKDFAIILKYALKNKIFKEIFMSNNYKTSDGLLILKSSKIKAQDGKNEDLSVISGSKTGYTSKAGLCLASVSYDKSANLLLVTTGANKEENSIGHFMDAKNLYNYYHNNYEYKVLISKNDLIKNIETEYEEKIQLKSHETVKLYLPKNINKKDLKYVYEGKSVLSKKVKKNDIIGSYIIKNKDNIIYKTDIKSPIDVKFRLKNKYKVAIVITITVLLLFLIIKKSTKVLKRL